MYGQYIGRGEQFVHCKEGHMVERPIMDTPKSGQLPYYNARANCLPPAYILSIHFYLRRRDNL